jgi:hypothetical protein
MSNLFLNFWYKFLEENNINFLTQEITMRSWYPIPASKLDRQRLLGEHNEIGIMARTISSGRKAWANHPETKRWRGNTKALKKRHDEIAEEMVRRGYNHNSPFLDTWVNQDDPEECSPLLIEPLEVMLGKLSEKQGEKIEITIGKMAA